MSETSEKPDKKLDYSRDPYDPDTLAERVMSVGVKKTRYPIYKTFVLGLLGGAFISLGALYELYVLSHPEVSVGVSVVLAPLFYAMGYILAFIAGAEVFTTNNLSVMGLASGKLSIKEVTLNWTVVLIANLLGALFLGVLYFYSGLIHLYDFTMVETSKLLTSQKLSLNIPQTVIVGVFGNMLICAGLWLAMAGKSVTDQFIALFLPVAAVPAMNF